MPDESEIRDDELRMIFLCCHPSLSSESSVALALTTVGGFGVDELARAFLTQRATIAQRLVRAKRSIRESGIGFELPGSGELNARLDSVLEVLYLMFNEGYAAHAGEQLVREDLCREALRLARLVAGSPFGAPRAHALASLMAFQAARFPARMDAQGRMVLLEDQDRTRWDRHLIGEGFRQLAASAEGDEISPYHVQAAIAAEHAKGSDWTRVLELFDELLELTPSPIVRLNRAVAVAKVHGSEAALRELDRLADEPSLRNYYLYLAIRARLLWELGDRISASHLYREAMRAQCSEPERQFLSTRLEACLA
jgi:RNA polymerase sigma-70 factor (ECF subfamily)